MMKIETFKPLYNESSIQLLIKLNEAIDKLNEVIDHVNILEEEFPEDNNDTY